MKRWMRLQRLWQPWRAHAPKSEQDLEQQCSPAILCLNRDPTSSKEITCCVWEESKEGSHRDFFQFSIHKFEKSISGKASFILNEDGEAVVSPCWCLSTGLRVYLVVSQSSSSSLGTEWPWNVLLFTTVQGSREGTLGGGKWHFLSCTGVETETHHPVLIHQFQKHDMHLKSDPKFLKLCFSLNLVEFHTVSNLSWFSF